MINSKRRSKKSLALALALASFPLTSFAADKVAAASPQECSRDWALVGQMKSKNYIFGLGQSGKSDRTSAVDEAKTSAYRDVNQQLQSSIESQSTVTETQDGSSYAGKINVTAGGEKLTGLRIVKEGSDAKSNITACAVAKFDVGMAYSEAEGKMNVLEKQLKDVFDAAKAKKYVEVLQRRGKAHELVKQASADIARADMFRMYLGADNESWVEKIKGRLADVDKTAADAKTNIVFVLPSGEFETTMSEVESKLSGEGFEVSRDPKGLKQPVRVTLEVKQLGAPRKTKTALGQTLIAKISVSLKDQSGKTLATNKGASVTGTGPDDDEALANIGRQLLVHVLETFESGLPGLIENKD